MTWQVVLFPLGVRLSTWLCVLAFAGLTARRHSVLPLIAAWVWLIGFEAAFDGLGLAMYGYVPDRVLPLIIGVFTVAWCVKTKTLRVSPFWVAATVLIWAVWVAFGFHWNSDGLVLGGLPHYDAESAFRWPTEVLNEAAKTAWALAYLVPLWRLLLDRRRLEEGRAQLGNVAA